MATYIEIRDLFSDSVLRNRIDVATIIAANDLLSGTPTAADQSWAAAAFGNPRGEGQKAFMAVLAVNNAATVAQITGATDAEIQTNVDGVVPSLVSAHAAS